MRKQTIIFYLAFVVMILALTTLACQFLYLHDNKYTASGPQGVGGVLKLDQTSLEKHPVIFLTQGWEYYGERLLSPGDFAMQTPEPNAVIYIGQYGGFDAGDPNASPHGSASYRLTILLPEEQQSYMLELPEIFSAYRAYLNGELVQVFGDPDPRSYRPETGQRTVTVQVGSKLEILIAVSDFSHLYSGLVYPPAFGRPDAVDKLLSARLIFRSVLMACALIIGLLALLVGLSNRREQPAVYYGLLCLFFVGYTSYPLVHTLIDGFYPFYVLENFSFCAMLITVMLLQATKNDTWRFCKRGVITIGCLMCVWAFMIPSLLTGGSMTLISTYSYLIMGYEWLTACFLTATALGSVWQGDVRSKLLLTGILVFDTSLVMDRLLPLHEPIVTGWYPELASFVLVLCIGAVAGREIAVKFRDNAVLEERTESMGRLAELQRENYALLLDHVEEIRAIQHNSRHHLIMIDGFLQSREYARLEAYIYALLSTDQQIRPISHTPNIVAAVLTKHYQQQAIKNNIEIKLDLHLDRNIGISDADLCAVFANLLENAVESCLRQVEGRRYIVLSARQTPSALAIHMENSTAGDVAGFGDVLRSSKGEARKGYGLAAIRSTAQRYNGDAEFACDNERGIFKSTVLLLFHKEEA